MYAIRSYYVQAEPNKEIDEAVGHIHGFLNSLPGPVVIRQKIEFFHQLVVNGEFDEIVQSYNFV